jgi:hypothetical protein
MSIHKFLNLSIIKVPAIAYSDSDVEGNQEWVLLLTVQTYRL